jgi:flagellar basal-body rod protein FlgB
MALPAGACPPAKACRRPRFAIYAALCGAGLARFLLNQPRTGGALDCPAPADRRSVLVNERLFGIHGAALTLRSERMGVIASNIANAATPGFKARDIDFNAALDARLARQRGGVTAGGYTRMLYRQPTMPSMDGNTVELNREQVAFAENAVAYSATLSFVQGRVNTITRALKGE